MTYTWDNHPDPERLAAYIEQALPPALRSDVEAHLTDCDDCRRVVMDSIDLLNEERVHKRRRFIYPMAGLAAAAVVVLAVWTVQSLRSQPGGDEPRMDQLIAAYAGAPERPVAGRLSIALPYAPAPPITRGRSADGGSDLPPAIRIAVAETEIAVQGDRSISGQWTRGLSRLIGRDFDGAITSLEGALQANGASSRLLSDLGAAYLARLQAGGPMEDGSRALAAVDRALALDPGLGEALFNRALALQAVDPAQAAAAWRAVMAQEPGSDWATEASSHLATQ